MHNTLQKMTVGFTDPWAAFPRVLYGGRTDLNSYERDIFNFLCSRKDHKLRAIGSYMEISHYCNMSRSTAKKYLKSLRVKGWIEAEPRYGISGKKIGNFYKVNEKPFGKQKENVIKSAIASSETEGTENIFKLLKEALQSKVLNDDVADALNKIENHITQDNATEKPVSQPKLEVIIKDTNSQEVEVYGEYENVKLKNWEHKKLIKKYGNETTDRIITELDSYIESSGKKYSGHYATIVRWLKKEKSGKELPKAPNAAKRNRFANFTPRERDFEEIERLEREHLMQSAGLDE